MTNEQIIEKSIPLLIAWFQKNKRNLPWRENQTPYHVWLSEIMLQQTRIEAVIPYFTRFSEALPTVESLSVAEDDVLMKLWQGLGYYSRARNLKKAAVEICKQYGGELPRQASELKKLPGIGDYTAGAISSICFGQSEPAVDGNVLRVIMRLTGEREDITLPQTKQRVTALLRAHYPTGEGASALTQGIMELGQVVCVPNGMPLCGECPLKQICIANQRNLQKELPVKSGKKARKIEEKTVFLLYCNGKFALSKRPKTGLLAGLWEFPNCEGTLTEQEVREAFVGCKTAEPCGKAKHIFTHIEWHMTGYFVMVEKESSAFTFALPEEIRGKYAVPSAFRAYLQAMEKYEDRE